MGTSVSGYLPRGTAAPELGELRSSGALKPLSAPRDAPARPSPTAPCPISSTGRARQRRAEPSTGPLLCLSLFTLPWEQGGNCGF